MTQDPGGPVPSSEAPARKVPYFRLWSNGNELRYVQEVLESGWLTTAGKTAALEREFAKAVGARFALAVNSCTAALHLACDALGVQRGEKVFVPSLTFTATAEVVRYFDADPVFIDVEYGSGLVTPEIVAQAIARHPETRYLMLVHYAGQAADMLGERVSPGILDLCQQHGVRVIEDAAHAFPARAGGRMVGSLGDATCFSFYANKTMTTAEGGMLTTDDEKVAARVKLMRLHGIDRDVWDRFTAKVPSWEYDVVAPGFKYNMPDLNAAVGLAQLEEAGAMRDGRERCAAYYLERLRGVRGLDLPLVHRQSADHAWHLFVVVLNEEAGVPRNRVIELLAARGIGTSVHYKPLHRLTYYRERYGLDEADYPNSERMWRGCLSLPIYPGLMTDELEYVCASLEEILGRSS